MGGLKMIVGLGNPGPQYSRNRHNIGFQIVERFAARHSLTLDKMQMRAMTGTGFVTVAGQRSKVLLVKPLTFMNASGDAVVPLARYYQIDFLTPEDKPSLAVILAPVRPSPPEIYATGGRLITVDYARFMPDVKSLNYITGILGQKRARIAGAVEALYRTPAGEITECTTSNFFVFRGDQLITPVAEVLPGVTRDVVLEIASDMFDVVLAPLRYAELGEFDEAFITSTTKEVMPIVKVDDIVIGAGRPGLRTQRLLAAFHHYVTTQSFE